jgi:hypothetical protein
VHTAVITGFADALQTAFVAGVPFTLPGFLVVLLIKQIPLRAANTTQAERLATAFETAIDPDADRGYRTNGDPAPKVRPGSPILTARRTRPRPRG